MTHPLFSPATSMHSLWLGGSPETHSNLNIHSDSFSAESEQIIVKLYAVFLKSHNNRRTSKLKYT
jgi:hypothetical protein